MTQKPENPAACENAECSHYPHYGAAPHECYWRKPGGFEKNNLGTSTVLPAETWPDSFMMELEEGENPEEQLKWGACGVYYCPSCKKDMPQENSAFLWSPHFTERAKHVGGGE